MSQKRSIPPPLGDTHNFGRHVTLRDGRIHKPRTVVWERLVLSGASPLRRLLDAAARDDVLGPDAFGFLPDLAFPSSRVRHGGEVERITLTPLPAPSHAGRRALAGIVGRALALFTWLGVSDLHWENLVLGKDARGHVVFAPLDVEMVLADLSMPTETKLLPDADPEYAEICRHACGVRRVLPYLGKPVGGAEIVEMADGYLRTLAFLDRHASAIAEVFNALPGLHETPIRVCLRGTGEYVRARSEPIWPPLLDAEAEQLARGDIPYFFRVYGQPGIRYFTERTLRRVGRLPLRGDVPHLDPLLSLSRGLRAPSRTKLREEGLFTLLGAFDHTGLAGTFASDALEVTFRPRTLVVKDVKAAAGEELRAGRNLSAFVGSVYLPCRCGEVRTVFVPSVTVCEAGAGVAS